MLLKNKNSLSFSPSLSLSLSLQSLRTSNFKAEFNRFEFKIFLLLDWLPNQS